MLQELYLEVFNQDVRTELHSLRFAKIQERLNLKDHASHLDPSDYLKSLHSQFRHVAALMASALVHLNERKFQDAIKVLEEALMLDGQLSKSSADRRREIILIVETTLLVCSTHFVFFFLCFFVLFFAHSSRLCSTRSPAFLLAKRNMRILFCWYALTEKCSNLQCVGFSAKHLGMQFDFRSYMQMRIESWLAAHTHSIDPNKAAVIKKILSAPPQRDAAYESSGGLSRTSPISEERAIEIAYL